MDKIYYDGWNIKSNVPMIENKKYYESIFSQGNGYMGIRGTLPEDGENKSYEKCSFVAGVFDFIKEGITDMVNIPDYMTTKISIAGELFDPLSSSVKEITQTLCMFDGTLVRYYLWNTSNGKKVSIKNTRFLSIDDVHTAVMRYEIQSIDDSNIILFETGIDSNVTNQPIEDDQLKQNDNVLKMISLINNQQKDNVGLLKVKTIGKADIHIAIGYSLETNDKDNFTIEGIVNNTYNGEKVEFNANPGEKYIFDKIVSVYTSRECKKEELDQKVLDHINKNKLLGYEVLYRNNKNTWDDKWDNSDIEIDGDIRIQTAIRYNIFQLIQTISEKDSTVNIGARGIMHGRYKGCYFWDTDIFMLPFYIHTNQEAAKNLVMYRYLNLPDARLNAKELNLNGARYPWMCSIDGREQCESWDIGKCEIHITADVAYAIDYYVQMTNDMNFYVNNAIEIYLETARYFESRLTYDESEDKYNLLFVKGPDEYCGITSNNTYTNWLIRYNLNLAIKGLNYLEVNCPEQHCNLIKRLKITKIEEQKWLDITEKISIPYMDGNHLYLQDDTFIKLEKLDIDKYKTDDIPLYHTICFDRLQRYRVLKQADLILLFTLRPMDFTLNQKLAAWNYYEPLTLHDSSLSYGVHANLAAQLGIDEQAYEYFEKCVVLDLENKMGNTGKEGLHFASFGASWQAIIQGFAGVQIKDDSVIANPHLPSKWKKLKFKFQHKDTKYLIEIDKNDTVITKMQ